MNYMEMGSTNESMAKNISGNGRTIKSILVNKKYFIFLI